MDDPKVLLSSVTATGAGSAIQTGDKGGISFQAILGGAANPRSATVLIEVSLDKTNWHTAATIDLALAGKLIDGFAQPVWPWRWTRGKVSAIVGSGTTVTLKLGV